MTTIEEAYAEVHRNAHITLFTAPPPTPANDAPAPFDVDVVMDAVRAAMLAAHVKACCERATHAPKATPCGGGMGLGFTWYCEGYKRIEELK